MALPTRSRREVLIAVLAGTGSAVLAARPDAILRRERPRLRVSVLEFEDRWTHQRVGLSHVFRSIGCKVAPLDLGRPATKQRSRPDLIAFGSFTNNGPDYKAYVEKHAESIQRFVASGRVVLEMTQSDQFGNTVTYLPGPLRARRGDPDLDRVLALSPEHPLVAPWFPPSGNAGASYFGLEHPNWETFEEWEEMQVLLASQSSGRQPCLLEGAYGKGRFLLSSLYIDKCFDAAGNPTRPAQTIERAKAFFVAVADHVRSVRAGRAPAVVPTPMPEEPAAGPMIGHTDENSTRIWFRPSPAHLQIRDWTCRVTHRDERVLVTGQTDAEHDFTLLFDVGNLTADRLHDVLVFPTEKGPDSPLARPASFRTAPSAQSQNRVVLGMGSCAPSTPSHVWTRILEEGCQGFVFLGDTPYVDTSDLELARKKHRSFLTQPEIARMVQQLPCWGTWDDHDFGRNDGHGDYPGKHTSRQAFTEYRANATFGHDGRGQPQSERLAEGMGIYTSFRRGPLEVYLLDPRWFSRTAPSWADPSKTTCLGETQWTWFRESLLGSSAPFKLITTGMIWDDKKNSEADDWHTYRHEREAIFDLIRKQKIPGCILIGGDIHVSRALNYGPRVGYDLWQFIVSPLHGRTIPSLNVPHPALVHSALEPHTFLRLDADASGPNPTLTATWINRDGERLFEVSLSASDLTPS